MESFTGNILSLSAVDNAVKKSKENFGIFGLSGCIDSAKPNIVHAIGKDFAKCLLVTYSETRGRELTSQLTFFDEEVYFYPPRDVLFYRSDVGGGAIESERATAIGRITNMFRWAFTVSRRPRARKTAYPLPLMTICPRWYRLERSWRCRLLL